MAHSLSAKKRIRQNIKRRIRNRAHNGALKKQIKHFEQIAQQSSDLNVVEAEYRLTQKKLDKLAAIGILHKNTVSRRKARLARQLNAAKAKAQSA